MKKKRAAFISRESNAGLASPLQLLPSSCLGPIAPSSRFVAGRSLRGRARGPVLFAAFARRARRPFFFFGRPPPRGSLPLLPAARAVTERSAVNTLLAPPCSSFGSFPTRALSVRLSSKKARSPPPPAAIPYPTPPSHPCIRPLVAFCNAFSDSVLVASLMGLVGEKRRAAGHCRRRRVGGNSRRLPRAGAAARRFQRVQRTPARSSRHMSLHHRRRARVYFFFHKVSCPRRGRCVTRVIADLALRAFRSSLPSSYRPETTETRPPGACI